MTRAAVVLVLAALIGAASGSCAAERVVLEIIVEDDQGSPVEGAGVRGFFFDEQVLNERQGDGRVSGITDENGRVEISGTEDLYVDVTVERDGYYRSTHRVLVRNRELLEKSGEQKIRLRKQVDPIAMRAKRVLLLVRKLQAGEPYGYDLVAGDFIAPIGKGRVKDLELSYVREDEGDFRWSWSLTIRFAKPGDGLIPVVFEARGSKFRSDYEAPANGYLGEWMLSRSRAGVDEAPTSRDDPNRGYYFRVRTELDASGAVTGGYYGKIYGEFPKVTYYLNPAVGSRNVEWDASRNLFGSLPVMERATSP